MHNTTAFRHAVSSSELPDGIATSSALGRNVVYFRRLRSALFYFKLACDVFLFLVRFIFLFFLLWMRAVIRGTQWSSVRDQKIKSITCSRICGLIFFAPGP